MHLYVITLFSSPHISLVFTSESVCVLFLVSSGYLDFLPVPSDFSPCLNPIIFLFGYLVCV